MVYDLLLIVSILHISLLVLLLSYCAHHVMIKHFSAPI